MFSCKLASIKKLEKLEKENKEERYCSAVLPPSTSAAFLSNPLASFN